MLAGTRTLVRVLLWVCAWLVCSSLFAALLFFNSSSSVIVGSHEAVVEPVIDRHVTVFSGPVIPDVRFDSPVFFGIHVTLGKTEADSTEELLSRYALLASSPEGISARIGETLSQMVVVSCIRGAGLGLVPMGLWVLVGVKRRKELRVLVLRRKVLGVTSVLTVVGIAGVWWSSALIKNFVFIDDRSVAGSWVSVREFLGPDVPVPASLEGVQVRGDVTTASTRRLIESAVDTYEKSRAFYSDAALDAAFLTLRRPQEDEIVAVVVSDRHNNVGMDVVSRAVADAADASVVFDAGDDTSTGSSWEAFSLDSLTSAFKGYEKFFVAGNHDNGSFVSEYLSDRDWELLDGYVVPGPGGSSLLGISDPRSSGLGSWRDETGLSFSQVERRLVDAACSEPDPVGTILVHDANIADEVLARGCADLVIGGHLHVVAGPTRVVAENGGVGYSFTTGTTGGAAYAFALGSKPRREATISLVTYKDARPVGVQVVELQTNGRWVVGEFFELDYSSEPN